MEITKETTMGEMIEFDRGIAYILMESGMHCVGCPSSIGESLEEACMVHGLDADEVLKNINEYLASKKEK
ncbi:MAG: DUF1858 domain-containing protein [Oscillospiraceae bacterium]|nr:DUF1858 domain-containing protein [Oscillospiraceae bacterium]MDD6084927.1 DUF1858 domain-containing protein [Oscillospiraceae bacterium]MDY3257878.1 DUF1858 domain-containing protein [Ruminococcus callidus]